MALRLKGKAPEPGEADRRYYMIDVQEGKRRERISSGTRNKALAAKKEQMVVDALRADLSVPKELLVALVRGEARASQIASRRASGPTFGEVGTDCVEKHWKHLRGWRTTGPNYQMVLDFIGPDTPMSAIDQGTVKRMIDHFKAAGNGPGTINRKLSILAKLFEWVNVEMEVTAQKPIFPRQKGERKRQFVFDEGEFEQMIAAILARDDRVRTVKTSRPIKYDAHLYADFFSVQYETGMRPGEAFRLPWADVNFATGFITVRHKPRAGLTTKNARTRAVPMTDRCRELLSKLPRTGKGPFAGLNYDRAHSHWEAAKEALGITDEDCVPYATRHSAGTRIIEATDDIHQAKEWLGHSNISLTANTYAHVGTKYLSRGAEALNRRRSDYEAEKLTRDSEPLASVLSDGTTAKKSH